HAPVDAVQRPGGAVLPLAALRGRRAVLLSAVARPASFCATAQALGVEVVHQLRYRDHHPFTAAEIAAATAAARARAAMLLTTQKDDARLHACAVERTVLRIGLRFLGAEPQPAEVGLG